VLEIREGEESLLDRLVRGDAIELGDEGDAARVVLVGRVVESLLRGQGSAGPGGGAVSVVMRRLGHGAGPFCFEDTNHPPGCGG
jgi:hypothetical protein